MWTEVAKLIPADPTVVGHFADSVAIDGDTIVVGARCDALLAILIVVMLALLGSVFLSPERVTAEAEADA